MIHTEFSVTYGPVPKAALLLGAEAPKKLQLPHVALQQPPDNFLGEGKSPKPHNAVS